MILSVPNDKWHCFWKVAHSLIALLSAMRYVDLHKIFKSRLSKDSSIISAQRFAQYTPLNGGKVGLMRGDLGTRFTGKYTVLYEINHI